MLLLLRQLLLQFRASLLLLFHAVLKLRQAVLLLRLFREQRPDAVARRRKTNQRTARENLDDLVDPGSFVEYGAFAIASQRTRRTIEDLIEKTPADGLIAGIGRVHGVECMVVANDPTVKGGSQGPTSVAKGLRALRLVC